jgi:hypothetical protein
LASSQACVASRSYAIASSVINGLYPSTLANQALRDSQSDCSESK